MDLDFSGHFGFTKKTIHPTKLKHSQKSVIRINLSQLQVQLDLIAD